MFLNRSLSSSVSITATASSASISDAVSTSNPADIYKFNLAQRSSLNLLASGLSADVNMAIVRDSNANGIVNDGEILGRSENAGTTIENIQLANLAAGDYFIIVEAGTNVASANYSLSLGANKVTGADILWRDTDNDQVGYWRFDGTTYRDTKVIAGISDDWKVEAIGDFDGDKSEDILWRNKVNGELVAYLMDGASGTIRSQTTLKHPVTGATWPVDPGWQVIGIGDVNGDGKGDIIWRNVAASAVSIWVMNGTQVLGATPTYADGVGLTVGAGFNLVAVADLNGDGKADLLWQHSSGVVIDWVMDGATRLGAVTMSNLPSAGYKIEAVNDFNGDGKADLFWRNSVGNVQMWLGTGQVDVYQATALSSTSNLPVSTVDMAWQIAGTDDFNSDGKADIAWRHQTLGVMSLWSMNGSQVNYMQNVALPNLSQKAVGASTRLETANIIQLAGISDSGESNSDWITNVRAPSFAGVTSAGSTVSLFGNNQLIGETKAAANGTWSIVTTILDDGIYDISQKVTNTGGGFTQQILPKKLMIDGTAADLQITEPIDGVAWDTQVELAGYLRDLDPQAKVEYSVKADGTLALSAVLSAAIEAPPTPTFLTKKTIGTTAITLGQATGSQIFKPYEIALKVTDRAGNISTQTYKGMRLNLPELTEERMLLPDSLMPTLPDDRLLTNVANANNPNDGSGALYIGVGGGWGYGSTGSGGAGGLNWNASSNTAPTIAASVLNPNEVIGYLPALRLALTTARDVLSNVPATATKKDSLKRHLELLMETGKVVESNGFYETMRPMLKGVFATAYAAGGITKRQAILNGWELAKALAMETKLTTLQIFETNLYATSLAALKQNNSTAPTTGLEAAVKSLAKTYARLNSVPDGEIDSTKYARYDRSDFLGALLHDGRASSGGHLWIIEQVVETSITKLAKHLLGQADVVKSLQFTDRLLQAASQVSQLYDDAFIQGVYGGYSYVTQSFNMIGTSRVSNSIRDTKFLARLSDLAFEIARSNPTVTAGVNPTSEWIETLWEGGNLQSAAGGLSDWFSSFRVEKPVNPDLKGQLDYGSQVRSTRWRTAEALDYADRLVQATRLIDDDAIRGQFQDARLLSSTVNWGADFRGNESSTGAGGLFRSPFTVLANSGDLDATASQLKQWYVWSAQGANTNEYEIPFARIELNNGKPIFQVDLLANWAAGSDSSIDLSAPNTATGSDLSISEGGLFTSILDRWTGKIKIKRGDGTIETYQGTSLRKIWLFSKAENSVLEGDKRVAIAKYIPLYLGDQVASVFSLKFNQTEGKFPTTWLEKIATAKDLAIQAAPEKFSAEAKQIWDSVMKHPLLTGGGLVAMGAIHVFAPPVAVALDAAFMAFFGVESALHLGAFFIKATSAKDPAGLRDAANELLDFVGSATGAATSGISVFAANKISKGAALAEVGSWFQKSANLGSEFLKAFSWDNILALRSNTGSLKNFFLLPALRSMGRSDVTSFLEYGETATISFLSSELPKLFSNPLEGLKSFGNKWNTFGQVIQQLDLLPDISSALAQYPRNLSGVLNAGVDGINAIQSRVSIMGDIPVLWAKRLSLMDSPLEASRTLEGLSYVARKRQELGLNTLKPGIVTNNVGYGSFNVKLPTGSVIYTGRDGLIAVSGPQSPVGTVAAPLIRRLTQSSSRPTDSEAKILESIADIIIQSGAQADAQGKYSGVKGTVQLFTERKPCDECTPLIKILWKNLFPNVEIGEVLHGPRYLPGDLQKDLNNMDNFTNVLK